ncbi:MAG: PAS domain-containing protein [Planctomycetes bacterium]|nr:PAS domain-containing protein [Planctomycetota bacterium]
MTKSGASTRNGTTAVRRLADRVAAVPPVCTVCACAAGIVALALGAGVAASFAILAAMVLAGWLGRRAGRGDAAAAALARAADRENERGAAAQLLSLGLAYERSRSVLEALLEGVLVVDAGGEVVLANPAARRALSSPLQDPEGRILWDVLPPELAKRAHEAWQALRRSDDDTAESLQQVRYSGIPCRDSVYDLTAVEATSVRTGQDFGSVFLLVDSTRNHELQRLKDSFLSSVSHELRTPLTNICAYAEILRNMPPGESAEWPEFVRVIHEEGLQLSRLVDGMFDYLQLESGEALFRNEEHDGAAVVRQVLRHFGEAAAARAITMEHVERSELPRLLGDAGRLAQVVRNLLDNALKFTPPKGRVRVAVGCRDEGWELRVEDSGPGVPPGDRRAVFEKFNQLCDHLTDKPSGTGLGLATSRAIVTRLGGLIWCEDSSLGGAAFVVMLPAVGQPRLATGVGGGF